MRIAVPVTLDVDVDAYALEYSIDKSDVREDVKRYAQTVVEEHFANLGVLSRQREETER